MVNVRGGRSADQKNWGVVTGNVQGRGGKKTVPRGGGGGKNSTKQRGVSEGVGAGSN